MIGCPRTTLSRICVSRVCLCFDLGTKAFPREQPWKNFKCEKYVCTGYCGRLIVWDERLLSKLHVYSSAYFYHVTTNDQGRQSLKAIGYMDASGRLHEDRRHMSTPTVSCQTAFHHSAYGGSFEMKWLKMNMRLFPDISAFYVVCPSLLVTKCCQMLPRLHVRDPARSLLLFFTPNVARHGN
jgi:hypothetical protein